MIINKTVCCFVSTLISFIGFSQTEEEQKRIMDYPVVIEKTKEKEAEEIPEGSVVYTYVETMPEYPGGINAFREFIAATYKSPVTNKDLKGNVIVQFVVEPDGSMSNIEVIRDLGYGTGFEAVRVLKLAEKWTPGIQDGKAVRVHYTLPIAINIQIKE